MSWHGGTRIMEDLIDALKGRDDITHRDRVMVYKKMIDSLMGEDWQGCHECLDQDSAYDDAFKIKFPESCEGAE